MASAHTPTVSAPRGGGRAFGLGPRRRVPVALGALLAAAAIAAVILLSTGAGGASSPARHAGRAPAASLTYGRIPSWLPSAGAPADRIVTASAAHPAPAAVEGDTVRVRLASSSALVTAVGPAIPRWVDVDVHSGHWNDANTAPASFTVTFAAPQGTLPLTASAFSILTSQGQVVHPLLTALDGGRAPTEVTAGHPVTVTLKVGLGEGDGELRWAPQGARVLVAWFYQLEFD